MTLARNCLTVFLDGDERPGIIVYGLGPREGRRSRETPDPASLGADSVQAVVLHGDEWEVVAWEIAFAEWPVGEAWRATVGKVLRAHIEAGCPVSWVGAEGIPFCDPPQLFDAACMSGGVLAWMTAEDADCPLEPNRELAPVDDAVLARLRHAAVGLADAS